MASGVSDNKHADALARTQYAACRELAEKYLHLTDAEFDAALARDFPPTRRVTESNLARVRLLELPDIVFEFSSPRGQRELFVFGRDSLIGFMLWSDEGKWTVYNPDNAPAECSLLARELMNALCAYPNVADMARLTARSAVG